MTVPVALLALLISGAAAHAQTSPPPTAPGFHRSGWLIGFAIGTGPTKIDKKSTPQWGGMVDFELGAMLHPSWAIVAHLMIGSAMADHPTFGPGSVEHGQLMRAAGARYLGQKFWLEAGLASS